MDPNFSMPPVKAKLSRGSRACIACRKSKTRCMEWENPPCSRCRAFAVECNFVGGRRGKAVPTTCQTALDLSQVPHLESESPITGQLEDQTGHDCVSSPRSQGSPYPKKLQGDEQTSLLDPFEEPFLLGSASSPAVTHPLPQPLPAAPPSPLLSTPYSVADPLLIGGVATLDERSRTFVDTLSLHDLQPINPLGVLLEASLVAAQLEDAEKRSLGTLPQFGLAAGATYFTGKRMGGRQDEINTSEILTFLAEEDVKSLFEIFWNHLHLHFPAIEKEDSSPGFVLQRSPALFNAICCIAGRYYEAKPEVISLLREFAKKELATFPTEKSLEFVQAQLLYLTFKPIPAGSYNMDLNWIRVGLAVRMAQDLNLDRAHLISSDSVPKERITSMRRTWLICTNLEKITALHLGKRTGTNEPPETEVSKDIEDVRLLHVYEYLLLLERTLEATRTLAINGADNYDDDAYMTLQRSLDEWKEQAEDSEQKLRGSINRDQSERQIGGYRIDYYYAQLLVSSISLKQTLETSSAYQPYALAKFQTSALALLYSFRDDLAALGHSKYCTDSQFTHITFAAISLLRSVQPQFRYLIIDKIAAGKLISKTATLLEEAARTWDHLPVLQAAFLRQVLRARLPEYKEPPAPQSFPPFTSASTMSLDLTQTRTLLNPNNREDSFFAVSQWVLGDLVDSLESGDALDWEEFTQGTW